MSIKIAIAGHTNTGKTTLIRTLMRTTIGEVGDAPNVTKKGKLYFYDGLQATFVDTPGFQHSSVISMHLDGMQLSEVWEEKLKYDLEALESIKQSDVVIYVGNLSVVPDDSYKEEIDVVKKIQPKVIAILNGYHKESQASTTEATNDRCKLWEEILQDKQVDTVIVFDAHWDKRSKEEKIYDSISKILDDEQKQNFIEGLNKFKIRQKSIRKEACESLAEAIERIQRIDLRILKNEYQKSHEDYQEYKDRIDRKIDSFVAGFIAYVNRLYEVSAEFPKASIEELKVEVKKTIDLKGRLGNGATIAGVFGSFGAGIGAVIFGVMGTVTAGALGASVGIPLGAQIGSGVGAAVGSLVGFVEVNDSTRMIMKSEQIEVIVQQLLAIIWGLSYNGYGRGQELSESEINNLKDDIKNLFSQQNKLNWLKSNHAAMTDFCIKIMDELEKRY